MKRSWIVLLIVLALLLAACAASGGGGGEPAAPMGGDEPAAPAGGGEPASQPEDTAAEPIAVAAPEPTATPEISDVPIFEGAENYKSTGDGSYISYVVPDTTVEIVSQFYQDELAAAGWEQKNKKDSGFGGAITILRSKPDKNISVTIDTNVVNNGVRVLITLVPK